MKKLENLREIVRKREYGLVWENKEPEEVEIKMRDEIPIFREKAERKIRENPDNKNYNFLLEGDNLHSLHLLQKTHANKIDVIYIDPPYNTGNNDFIYNDKRVDKTDEFRHSKWLSFMQKRLKLAKNLLSDSGVIFISIDDNEQAHLKILCDQIFGEEYFVANIPRLTSPQRSGQENFANISHDYVLVYSYGKDFYNVIEKDVNLAKIKTDKNGTYIEGDTKAILAAESQGYSAGGDYDFEFDGKIYSPILSNGKRNRWLWTRERMKAAADLGILVKTKNSLRMRIYQDKVFEVGTNKLIDKSEKMKFHTADLIRNNNYSNPTGDQELKKIRIRENFSNPKPTNLIEILIKMASQDRSATILDFFAGSGTTGHAVLKLNATDGGSRKFILCTNNENGIAENITYERIKRVISGYGEGSRKTDGIPANLKYFTTDFVAINSRKLENELLANVYCLIELENGVDLLRSDIAVLISREEAENFAKKSPAEIAKFTKIYIRSQTHAMLELEVREKFASADVKDIPEYYFAKELKNEGVL